MVNLASRIESLNKHYGTYRLVSENVVAMTGDRFLFRQVDRVIPVGTSVPIDIFELLGEVDPQSEFVIDDADRARCAKWAECFDLYRSGQWREARDAFAHYGAVVHRDDPVAQILVERCSRFAAEGPPLDWTGALRLVDK